MQFDSSSGITCKNGHGGAPAMEELPRWQRGPVPEAHQSCRICTVIDMRPKVYSDKHKGPVHYTCAGRTDAPCIACPSRIDPRVTYCKTHEDAMSPTICVFCQRCQNPDRTGAKIFFESIYGPPHTGVAHSDCLEEATEKAARAAGNRRPQHQRGRR